LNKHTKAPTIKDVAQLSGVSWATVSRVINGGNGVSDKLKERVLQAVKTLGYYPNRAAQALINKETGSIGVVLNNLHDPYFYDLLRGFGDAAKKTSYNVVLCNVPSGDAAEKEKYVKYLTNGVVDGIILYGSYLTDAPIVHYLHNETTCDYIIIENNIPDIDCNELLVDNASGVEQAIAHLIELGHRKIAHIGGDLSKMVSKDRLDGYINTMLAKDLTIEAGYIQNTTADYRLGYACMQNLMNQSIRPTAVFCCDDAIASYAIRAALDMGISVPQDISVVGFDNQKILPERYMGPAVTSIEQPLYDIGKESILLLAERLQGNNSEENLRKVYRTKLVVKDSTGPV